LGVFHRLIVLFQPAVEDAQGRMSQSVVGICRQQFLKLANRFLHLALLL